MSLALVEAKKSLISEDVPVGAIIVDCDGKIISKGFNQIQKKNNPLMHAEIIAIDKALRKTKAKYLYDYTIYVTLEPCPMCAGAIVMSRIGKVIFGADDPKAGAVNTLFNLLNDERLNHRCEIKSGVLADEASKLLKTFFQKLRLQKKNYGS